MWKDLAAVAVLTIAITHPVQLAAEEAPVSQKSLAEQLVDAFNAVFGVHPGMRANHPKGVVLEGTFTPSPSAASLTKAAHLQKRKAPNEQMLSGLPPTADLRSARLPVRAPVFAHTGCTVRRNMPRWGS